MSEVSLEEISKNLYFLCSEQVKNVLTMISKDYNLNKQELFNRYLSKESFSTIGKKKKKKNKLEAKCLCMARKQDGNQCTRRRKGNQEYCGKHINNRRYGRIDEHSNSIDKLAGDDNYIMTWVEEFDGEEYLVDSNNIVYSRDIESPKIVGKKIGDGVLQPLEI